MVYVKMYRAAEISIFSWFPTHHGFDILYFYNNLFYKKN